MYRNYCLNRQIPATHKIKPTSFYILTSKLTHSDPKLREAVDYVTGFLINDSFKTVENIIVYVKSATENKDWIQQMELVRRYLKYDFEKGILIQHKCPAHDFAFGLGTGSDNNLDGNTEQFSWMQTTKLFFHQLTNVILSFPKDQDSAVRALQGAKEKAILFMGHHLPVLNQQKSVDKTLESIRQNFLNGITECLVTIDYKMKLDTVKYAITTCIETRWDRHPNYRKA
jgi:hypothetical protein